MDTTYCYKECLLGKAKCIEYLKLNNSALEAAFDFKLFIEECSKTCPYKNLYCSTSNN